MLTPFGGDSENFMIFSFFNVKKNLFWQGSSLGILGCNINNLPSITRTLATGGNQSRINQLDSYQIFMTAIIPLLPKLPHPWHKLSR